MAAGESETAERAARSVGGWPNYVAATFTAASIIAFAGIFENQLHGINTFAFIVIVSMTVVCLFVPSRISPPWVWLLAVGWFTLVIFERLAYNLHSNTPLSASVLLNDFCFISFIVYFATNVNPKTVARLIYFFSVGYMLYYIYVAYTQQGIIRSNIPDMADMYGYIASDSSRSSRVILANTFASFVVFYAITELMSYRRFLHIGPLAVAIVAIYFAQSRLAMAITLAALPALVLSPRLSRYISIAGFTIFVVWSAILLFGLIDPKFNVFFDYASDDSAFARAHELDAAISFIRKNPITGIGVGDGSVAYQNFVGCYVSFSAQDIGLAGVWTQYGLIGAVVFVACTYTALFPHARLNRIGTHARTLRSIGFMIAMHGLLAPSILMGSGRIVFALILYTMLCPNSEPRRDYRRAVAH